jgi:hypothetical protein
MRKHYANRAGKAKFYAVPAFGSKCVRKSSGKMTTNSLANFLELSEQWAANLATQNDIHKFPRAILTED